MNLFLDSVIFLLKTNEIPEISFQNHQRIILCFYQLMENKRVSFTMMKKFIKYTEGFQLSNRINTKTLLKNLMVSRTTVLEEQMNLPEILNFFTQSNANKRDLHRLLDQIIPIYDQNLGEIDDSALISLLYHVVYLGWNYDKKPEDNRKKREKIQKNDEKIEKNDEKIEKNDEEIEKNDEKNDEKTEKNDEKTEKNDEKTEKNDEKTEKINEINVEKKNNKNIDKISEGNILENPEENLSSSDLSDSESLIETHNFERVSENPPIPFEIPQSFPYESVLPDDFSKPKAFKSKFSKKRPFLYAIELELGLRLEKMSLPNLLEFSRILSLNSISNYRNSELFLEFQRILITKLPNLSEENVIFVVKNLRFFTDFSSDFSSNFENIMKSCISEYRSLNLFLLLKFVRGFGFKSRSILVYNILLVLNKNCMKSVTHSLYESIQEYGKNRSNITFLINDLLFLAANQVEEDYMMKYSFFPKKILKLYWEKMRKSDKTEKNQMEIKDKKEIIESITKIASFKDFLTILLIANKINLRDSMILNTLFEVFKLIYSYNAISMHQYCEVLSAFHELNYYIDLNEEISLISRFLNDLEKKQYDLKVYEQYSLIKILSIFIRHAIDENHVILPSLMKNFTNLKRKIIMEKTFFVLVERLELLRFLALSSETCDQNLVNYLYSLFCPKRNCYFSKEADFLPKNDFINRIIERIDLYLPNKVVKGEFLEKIMKQTEFLKEKETLASQPVYFASNLAEQMKSEILQYLEISGLKNLIKIEENIREFSFEFDLKLTNNEGNSVFVDIHGKERHCYVNRKNKRNSWTLAKAELMGKIGKEYVEIFEEEWMERDKKELLVMKVGGFLKSENYEEIKEKREEILRKKNENDQKKEEFNRKKREIYEENKGNNQKIRMKIKEIYKEIN